MEYLLLLAFVMIIVLVGLQLYGARARSASELYFNRVGEGILGEPNPCGDGLIGFGETQVTCCKDVGGCNN